MLAGTYGLVDEVALVKRGDTVAVMESGVKLPDLGAGLAAVGLAEASSNLVGDSVIDRVGRVMIANTPLPLVEETIKRLGVTDKPVLRANVMGGLALAVGLATPGRRSPKTQLALAAAGLAAAGLGRRRLNAIEAARRVPFKLPPVTNPLPNITDGAEAWSGVEPLLTEPGRFYQTDINLRPPAIDPTDWMLGVNLPAGSAQLRVADLLAMELKERDAALVCVHNRPGWDRLGQQCWTGVPIGEVLALAGNLPEDPESYDLVTAAVDGYTQVIPLDLALDARTWLVIGMAGAALPREHGFPARVMTPGLVGQYNGVKWLSELRVVPRGSEESWWVRRKSWFGEAGWPSELVWVKPMARIDSPSNTGMPPRLPPSAIRVEAGDVDFVGTAWAPPHGVGAVEARADGGEWSECELAREINGDSWRRWRTTLAIPAGGHTVEARCRGADGTVQAGGPAEPFPHGAGAYHRVVVEAIAGGRLLALAGDPG